MVYTLLSVFCKIHFNVFREGGSSKKPRRRKQAQPKSVSESEESEDEESDGDFGMEPLPSPKGSTPPGSPPTVSPGKNEPRRVACCPCLCGLLSMSGLLIPGVIRIPVGISSLCLGLGFVLSVCCVACDITIASLLFPAPFIDLHCRFRAHTMLSWHCM